MTPFGERAGYTQKKQQANKERRSQIAVDARQPVAPESNGAKR